MRSNGNGSIKRDKCFRGYMCVRTRMRIYVCSRMHKFCVGKAKWDEAGK